MSFLSTFIDRSTTLGSRSSRNIQSELPLFSDSRYPAPPSFPPPPITSSVYSPAAIFDQKPKISDDMRLVQRTERQLEEELQMLLDAQAEGLMAGLGGAAADDQASTGSSTPTVNSLAARNTSPARQLVRRKPGLSTARRRIGKTIQQLAVMKAEELHLLDEDLESNQAVLDQIAEWEGKRRGLEEEIHTIEHNDVGDKSRALQDEANQLESEIRHLEDRLAEMKARHRRLTHEANSVESSVQAKLSTYKTSLSLLDSEVQKFLSRPPLETLRTATRDPPFMSFSRKRRTLVMVKDFWQEQTTKLSQKFQDVEVEREALEEGAEVWDSVVKRITAFEVSLREELAGITGNRQWSKSQSKDGIASVLARMDEIIQYLESKLELAEGKGWRLLECSIGAELQTLKQGRDLLSKTQSQGSQSPKKADREQHTSGLSEPQPRRTSPWANSPASKDPESEDSHDWDPPSSPSSKEEGPPHFRHRPFDTDDDEPDPELLISHQDTDTD